MLIVYLSMHTRQSPSQLIFQGKESSIRTRILESKLSLHVAKHESEFAVRLNCAAQYGDLHRLKCFVEAGADLNLTDYSGRSALVSIRCYCLHICSCCLFSFNHDSLLS